MVDAVTLPCHRSNTADVAAESFMIVVARAQRDGHCVDWRKLQQCIGAIEIDIARQRHGIGVELVGCGVDNSERSRLQTDRDVVAIVEVERPLIFPALVTAGRVKCLAHG